MNFLQSEKCLRRLVIAYNIFFWVTGPGIVGLGVWMFIALAGNEPVVIRDDFADPSYVIIVAGVISVIAGIVGCLGGVNEHVRFLNVYFLLMFIVCVLEVTATVLSFTQYDKMESTLKTSLTRAIHQYYTDGDSRAAVDHVQRNYECCGLVGLTDWVNSTLGVLPPSCCPETDPPTEDVCSPLVDGVYIKGCLHDVTTWTRRMLLIGGWTVFAMSCTQLVAMAVICCFTKAVSLLFMW